MNAHPKPVGRVPPHGERANAKNAASGDAAYNATRPAPVGRVPSRGEAPTGRKKLAQGKEPCDAALGHESQNTSSPEGVKENESLKSEVKAGRMLLRQILSARCKEWKGRGKYKEPVAPCVATLPRLPAGWCWAGTEQVTAGIDNAITIGPFGSNLMVKDYRDSGVSLIFVREIRSENFRRHDTRYVSREKAAELSTHKVRGGDVVITKMGEPPGDTAIYPENLPDAIATSDCIKLTPNPKAVTAAFLKYAIRSRPVKDQIERVTRGVAQKKMSLARFKTVAVPLAPLLEQRRIVLEIEKQFTRLEAGVAALRQVQANLKRYRAAVLKAACEGRLVPTEAELVGRPPSAGVGGVPPRGVRPNAKNAAPFETGEALLARILTERRQNWQGRGQYKEPAAPDTTKLFNLPAGWMWTTLDALAEIKGGITKDQNRKHTAHARSVPYLRVANVQRGYIDLTEVKEIVTTEDEIQELALKPGDILFNEGGDRDKLGRGWIWNGEMPECIHQNHVFRARLHVAGLNPKLISWYANTFGQKFFFDEGKHTTNLASISMSKLKGLPVPIPPPAEQTRIVAEVERRLSVVEELEAVVSANLQRATRLRQSILQKAFTGELV